jgi:hypothetical protein
MEGVGPIGRQSIENPFEAVVSRPVWASADFRVTRNGIFAVPIAAIPKLNYDKPESISPSFFLFAASLRDLCDTALEFSFCFLGRGTHTWSKIFHQ